MKLKLIYAGQLGLAAGIPEEAVEVSPQTTVSDVVGGAGERLPDEFRKFVFRNDGKIEPTLLFALDGVQLTDLLTPLGENASELMLLPPIAGG